MIHAPRPDLDAAIDRVATKLVGLPEDAGLLPRVLARLPERASSPWWVAMPVQLAAGAALVLMAFLWARPLDRPAPPMAQPVAATAPMATGIPAPGSRLADAPIPDPRSLLRQGFGGQALIPDPRSPIPDLALDRPDHERSLAPVEPLQALTLESIAPAALEPDATVVITPLVLTDLPLASESSPQER